MKRGEVRWYEFRPPDKRRPVLVLTRDSAIPWLSELTVAPITSTVRGIPSEVILGTGEGLPKDCAVNFDHVQTVPKRKIGSLVVTLSTEQMARAGQAIAFALGLDTFLE